MLSLPKLVCKAVLPIATLRVPSIFAYKASLPTAVLEAPVVFVPKEPAPIATFESPSVFAVMESCPIATSLEPDVLEAFELEGVNKDGVDKVDLKYLKALKKHQPAGLNTLVSVTNIAKDTIEEVVEPFLLRNNLIKKTTKGRILC